MKWYITMLSRDEFRSDKDHAGNVTENVHKHMLFTLNERTLKGELWESVVETVGSQEIHPDCANCLRAWIVVGVERMEEFLPRRAPLLAKRR